MSLTKSFLSEGAIPTTICYKSQTLRPRRDVATPRETGVRRHSGNRVPGDLGQERFERREGIHDDGEPDQVAHEEPAHRSASRRDQDHPLHTSPGVGVRQRVLLNAPIEGLVFFSGEGVERTEEVTSWMASGTGEERRSTEVGGMNHRSCCCPCPQHPLVRPLCGAPSVVWPAVLMSAVGRDACPPAAAFGGGGV